MTGQPWFRRDAGRAQREVDALNTAGIGWVQDDSALTRDVWAGTVTVPGRDGPIRLHAVYPDEFPYFPPQVTTTDVTLDHHHAPGGHVCLLAPDGTGWLPGDTLASLLQEQWPKVLADDGTDAEGNLVEVDQAEPWTAYLPTKPGQSVRLPAAVTPPAGSGVAHVICVRSEPLALTVTAMFDAAGAQLMGDFVLHTVSAPPGAHEARWVRLAELPPTRDTAALWQAVLAQEPSLNQAPWSVHPSAGVVAPKQRPYVRQLQVVLVCVPEETGRRQLGDGWIALVRTRPNSRKPPSPVSLLRVVRAGKEELYTRAPELRSLAEKSVLVIGCGGLGSEIVLGLGKLALRRLDLVDGDTVDAAAAVRFGSAARFDGAPKVLALLQLVSETQPYTSLSGDRGHLGVPRLDGPPPDESLLERIASVDLVIDATAHVGVQHYLSDLARHASVAYLQAEATRGVWGGLIALYRPGSDVCWMCVQHYLYDGTLPPLPASPADAIQLPGCLEPTYTGTGFDLAAIAAQAVRAAAAYLAGPEGYGPMPADVVTVRLRDAAGVPLLPQWACHSLATHPNCTNHPR